MTIWKLDSGEAPAWSWAAAECVADVRVASGDLSRGAALDLTRSIVSTFRSGIPEGHAVWCDDAGGWIWFELTGQCNCGVSVYGEQFACEPSTDSKRACVRGGFIPEDSNIEIWADFIRKEFSGYALAYSMWGDDDSLVRLAQALGSEPVSAILAGSVTHIQPAEEASGAWLRPMSASELMRFQVAAANELGGFAVACGEYKEIDEARRQAFRSIQDVLSDGIASPGHRLYALCHGGQTVGGAWLEIDGSVSVVRALVVESDARGQGHYRAGFAALAAVSQVEGARQIRTMQLPAEHPLVPILTRMGLHVVRHAYNHTIRPQAQCVTCDA